MTTQPAESRANHGCPHRSLGAEFDPVVNATSADPYLFFARARAEEPVFFCPAMNAWVVTRYEDVVAVLKAHGRFSSAGTFGGAFARTPEAQAILDSAGMPLFVSAVINTDPPEHGRLRASVSRAFSARRMAVLEPSIRALAERLVDGFIAMGRADFMSQFAASLPMQVICRLLNVPEADAAKIQGWIDAYKDWLFVPLPPERQIAHARELIDFQRYVVDLLDQHRAHPQDDFICDLLHRIEAGEVALTTPELVEMVAVLFLAGYETTRNALSNCMIRLLSDRPLWAALCADASLLPDVVEEAIRMDGIGFSVFRITTEAVELGGASIPKHALVLVMIASASHDEAQFQDPETFQPRRPNASRHMGFGHGVHYCVGAPLARLEMQVALDVLRTRVPDLRHVPDQALHYEPSAVMRSPLRLLLEWSPCVP